MLQMNQPWKPYAKWKKSAIQSTYNYVDCTYIKVQDKQIQESHIGSCLPRCWQGEVGNGKWLLKGMSLLSGVRKDTLKIDHGDGCTTQWI